MANNKVKFPEVLRDVRLPAGTIARLEAIPGKRSDAVRLAIAIGLEKIEKSALFSSSTVDNGADPGYSGGLDRN